MKLIIFVGFFFVINTANKKVEAFRNDDLEPLEEEFATALKLNEFNHNDLSSFKKILTGLNVTQPLQKIFSDKSKDLKICLLCNVLVKEIQRRSLTVKTLGEAICNIYITLATWTVSDFCEEIIRINLPIFEYILNHSKILDPELACSIMLQNKECYFSKPALKWRVLPPSDSTFKIPQINYNPNAKPLKILHLSDFHLSPDYEIGAVSDCGYPVCCKKGLGHPAKPGKAGPWGDYNCDIPLWLFGETMYHINQTHKDIDLVYFTGDIIDHTVWKSSKINNTNLIYFTFKTLFETFGSIPVLPVIGNHESTPLNVYPPPFPDIEIAGLSMQWLYTLLSTVWRAWLPKESLLTVSRQGYYAYTINEKLKVIALNNNVCYNFNWWLLYDTTYLSEQLLFLKKELKLSESIGQFVHIIQHIPVGNKECIEPWEVSFHSIVTRFSHIIKGQFYGHTHTDELKIFYDDYLQAINIGYNGGSLTPYQKYNPNYKIFTLDPNTYEVMDVDTYYFNLTEANQHPHRAPGWTKLYSMKDAYNINSITPENIDKVFENIFTNTSLFEQYWKYYVRLGDLSLRDGCNNKCRKEVTCQIFTTESVTSAKYECQH